MVSSLQQALLAEACSLHEWLENERRVLGNTRRSHVEVNVLSCNRKKGQVGSKGRIERLGESTLGMCEVRAAEGIHGCVFTLASRNVKLQELDKDANGDRVKPRVIAWPLD